MSLINRKKFHSSGFTLMEMIVVVALLGVVGVMASSLMLASLVATTKAEVTKEARQNGAYALAVMEGLIISSKAINCVNATTLQVTDLAGGVATFLCQSEAIASNSSLLNTQLTSSSVRVTNCSFACTANQDYTSTVEINFTVNKSKGDRFNEGASVDFSSKISTRNKQD